MPREVGRKAEVSREIEHPVKIQIKFYWNTSVPIHPHIVYGCFLVTEVELSSCEEICGPHGRE